MNPSESAARSVRSSGGDKIIAQPKNESMGSVVRSGAKQTGNNNARRDRSSHRRVGAAREREVHIVHNEASCRGRRY